MKGRSRWVTRNIKCPEGKGMASLVLEWKTDRGKDVLHSISCDHPQLMDYSGEDCRWQCLERLSHF
jgi:hypothetical protein